VSSSKKGPCGPPNVSPSISERKGPCGPPNVSPSISEPCGLICIKDVGLQGATRVKIPAGMQHELLESEDSMDFIMDSGASRTSTFEERDFLPGTLKTFEKSPVLTGISGSLEIKGEGDIQFQVVMDNGNMKAITTKAYWTPQKNHL